MTNSCARSLAAPAAVSAEEFQVATKSSGTEMKSPGPGRPQLPVCRVQGLGGDRVIVRTIMLTMSWCHGEQNSEYCAEYGKGLIQVMKWLE